VRAESRRVPGRSTRSFLHQDSGRNRLIGIGLISGAVLWFSVLDTAAKSLVVTLPLLQLVFLRFLGHTVFTAVAMAPRFGWSLVRTRHPLLQLARATMLPLMTAMNFWALQFLQLAETGAIQFLAPIVVALLGNRFLGEKLDRGRWIAIVVGFIGVLVILQPGSRGFHPAMLVSLLQTTLYAIFILLTRVLAADDRPESSNFLSALGATLMLAPFAIAVWQTPTTAREWTMIAVTGIAGGLGHYLLAQAPRFAPASTITPFIYSQILYMVLLGYLVFGDVPRPAVVVGALIVVGSGLYLVWRERGIAAPAAARR
jgi:drug/metabolite transporter (DMT)-like permease